MWYHSALTLMLVEITARSESQIMCLIVVYIINAIFNAILFGIYFELLEEVRRRQNEFQLQLDNANTAMAVQGELDAEIKEDVRNYILQTHETKTLQLEEMAFQSSMPPSRNSAINALNFMKLVKESANMINFRLMIRARYLNKLRLLQNSDLNDPNVPKPDIRQGDKVFK